MPDSEKIIERSQSAVERDQAKHKIGLEMYKKLLLGLEFNKPNKQNVYEIN